MNDLHAPTSPASRRGTAALPDGERPRLPAYFLGRPRHRYERARADVST